MLLLLFARYYGNANLFGANWRCMCHLVTYRMGRSPLKIALITLLLWVSLYRLEIVHIVSGHYPDRSCQAALTLAQTFASYRHV